MLAVLSALLASPVDPSWVLLPRAEGQHALQSAPNQCLPDIAVTGSDMSSCNDAATWLRCPDTCFSIGAGASANKETAAGQWEP